MLRKSNGGYSAQEQRKKNKKRINIFDGILTLREEEAITGKVAVAHRKSHEMGERKNEAPKKKMGTNQKVRPGGRTRAKAPG